MLTYLPRPHLVMNISMLILGVELPAEPVPLVLTESQYTRRRRCITLTLENTFVHTISRNVQLFSGQPGFGFIGIMTTPTRQILILSENMQEQGRSFECIKESQALLYDVSFSNLPEVCRGRFDPGANPTVPSEETLMDQLLLIDSDTLFKCVKIGREHYTSRLIPTADLKRGFFFKLILGNPANLPPRKNWRRLFLQEMMLGLECDVFDSTGVAHPGSIKDAYLRLLDIFVSESNSKGWKIGSVGNSIILTKGKGEVLTSRMHLIKAIKIAFLIRGGIDQDIPSISSS